MQRLDASSAARWCGHRGILLSEDARRIAETPFHFATRFSLALPREGLRAVDLANWVLSLDDAAAVPSYSTVLVWLLDWDIWSVERERVGLQLMHALLGADDIKERPAVEFTADEVSAAQAIISIVALFQWDAVVAPSHGEYVFRFSHHGTAESYARVPDVHAAIVDGIRHFEDH